MNENNAYLQRKIATLSTAEMNVLLLNKAIFCLEKAQAAIADRDFQAYHDHSQKVVKIIVAMGNAIHDYAKGEFYDQLGTFFKTILQLMIQLNLKLEVDLAQEIINLLQSNRDAWQSVVEQSKVLSSAQPQRDLGSDTTA